MWLEIFCLSTEPIRRRQDKVYCVMNQTVSDTVVYSRSLHISSRLPISIVVTVECESLSG